MCTVNNVENYKFICTIFFLWRHFLLASYLYFIHALFIYSNRDVYFSFVFSLYFYIASMHCLFIQTGMSIWSCFVKSIFQYSWGGISVTASFCSSFWKCFSICLYHVCIFFFLKKRTILSLRYSYLFGWCSTTKKIILINNKVISHIRIVKANSNILIWYHSLENTYNMYVFMYSLWGKKFLCIFKSWLCAYRGSNVKLHF